MGASLAIQPCILQIQNYLYKSPLRSKLAHNSLGSKQAHINLSPKDCPSHQILLPVLSLMNLLGVISWGHHGTVQLVHDHMGWLYFTGNTVGESNFQHLAPLPET